MKKINIALLCLLVVGCSNLPFNERFNNVGWKKVIIAPFTGNSAKVAEAKFEHALAVSSKFIVISSSMSLAMLKENDLSELHTTDPTKALFLLAEKINAQGVIFGEATIIVPQIQRRGSMASSTAEIYVKLVDVESKSIVATSHHNSSSMFSGANSLVQNVLLEAIDDFYEYFDNISSM